MLKKIAVSISLCGAMALAACETTDPNTGQVVRSNARTGVLAGALGGAALGALTNTHSGIQAAKNALLGAGIGALAGGLVGNYMDKQQAQLRQQLAGSGVDVQRQGDNIVLNMPGDITFDTNQADISSRFYPTLDQVAQTLSSYPQTYVDVVGFTDSTGSDALNQGLSERRAQSVAAYLQSHGVVQQRITVTGMGKRNPIATNATPDGRAKNRRVQIVLTPVTA